MRAMTKATSAPSATREAAKKGTTEPYRGRSGHAEGQKQQRMFSARRIAATSKGKSLEELRQSYAPKTSTLIVNRAAGGGGEPAASATLVPAWSGIAATRAHPPGPAPSSADD